MSEMKTKAATPEELALWERFAKDYNRRWYGQAEPTQGDLVDEAEALEEELSSGFARLGISLVYPAKSSQET